MTSTLVFHSANDLPIGQRRGDGYLNATALCKAAGKKWSHYFENETTKEYLAALSENLGIEIIARNPVVGIPAMALIQVLYLQMTQAEFEAIPIDEQWIYLETPQERKQRQRQELREMGYWTSHRKQA